MKPILFKKLEDQYIQIWNCDVDTNGKCTIYRIFKTDHSFEPYLTKLTYVDRIYLCRYRGASHNLPVSESRHDKSMPPIYCEFCDMIDTPDEYHYLLQCKKFAEQRKKYLKSYYYTRPNTLKMYELFNSTNAKILSNLAILCKEIIMSFKKSKTALCF